MTDDRRHGQRAGIDPARIEAAARARYERNMALYPSAYRVGWDEANQESRDYLIADTTKDIEAAFPELVPEIFDGLPHAWIAPWEATQAMADAGRALDDALGGPAYPRDYYRAMRDAHLEAAEC